MDEQTGEYIEAVEPLIDTGMAERTLLLVDDEPSVTKALQRVFARLQVRVISVDNGHDALAILAREAVGVIITDQRMPEMTGVELLSQVHAHYPDITRIVLTGQADMDAVMDAVNKGAVYKFLVKPWNNENLKACVEDAFRHHELILERRKLMLAIERANNELQQVNVDLHESVEEKTQQLIELTQYDALTKLPNRLLFLDRLQQAMLHADRQGSYVAILMLGLDRFKLVNDSFGSTAGDGLLRQLAERLKNIVQKGDTVARISGDEFGLLVGDIDDIQDAARIAENLRCEIAAPFLLNGREFFTQASIGISVYPDGAGDGEHMIQQAGTAMHHAKDAGGNRCEFYLQEMNQRAAERLELENDLRLAVEKGQFALFYQPQMTLANGELAGIEALIRWHHPDKGIISPGLFIPVLEEIGLINGVGEWVIRTACEQSCRWQQMDIDVPRLSVNLSVRQFDMDDLVERVSRIMQETGFDPGKGVLEFEVTESLVIRDVDKVITTLTQLHELGIRIAIDDFGTGYASLSYLTRFPIHTLKIDMSFIRQIEQGESDQAIVIAIIALARSLGVSVIAEGVETELQLDFLREHGCDEIQGYYYAKPLSQDDVTRRLQQKRTS